METPMLVVFPLICAGLIVVGVLVIKYRKALWDSTRERQRRIFGRHVAGAFERVQSSFWIGAVGVFAVIAGILLLLRFVILVLA